MVAETIPKVIPVTKHGVAGGTHPFIHVSGWTDTASLFSVTPSPKTCASIQSDQRDYQADTDESKSYGIL